MTWKAIVRSWYVLRYYRPSQLTMRALKRLGVRLPGPGLRLRLSKPLCVENVRENVGFGRMLQSRRDQWEHRPSAYCPQNHRVTFLNECREFGEQIDWRCRSLGVPLLWRFHLHYHEFLLDLLRPQNGGPNAFWGSNAIWTIIGDWIHRNQPGDAGAQEAAWHPYCISRRLPIWMMVWAEHPPPFDRQTAILESLHRQAACLATHLEWDLRGNHLLQNLTTLLLASLFFEGPLADRWRRKASRLLRAQIREQILNHGEHVERAPMYHAQMLQALLDVRDVVAEHAQRDAAGLSSSWAEELAAVCQNTCDRMARWLAAVLAPDGRIPLLSDGAFDECPQPGVLLRRVAIGSENGAFNPSNEGRKTPQTTLGPKNVGAEHAQRDGAGLHGDAWTWRDGDSFLLFDTGPVGPDWLPAHAHCDLLTLEASVAGRRLFVDSGTYDYEDGEMRRYCRATGAHNVLQIDGQEQCDMWSRFRMGYRGWPKLSETGESSDISWCRATHNAYRRLGVAEVGRWIGCRQDGPWVCVDWVTGRGEHQLIHWLHLHPEVEVRPLKKTLGRASVDLRVGDRVCELRFLMDGELTLDQGWYCPEFGRRFRSPVLSWTTRATPTGMGTGIVAWLLQWNDIDCNIAIRKSNTGESMLDWGGKHFRFMNRSGQK